MSLVDTSQKCDAAIPLHFALSKRAFDIVFSVLVLLMLWPLFLIVAAAIAMNGGSPFFVHKRVGRHGREFGCLKFRTMAVNGDELLKEYLAANPEAQSEWEQNRKLANDPRVSPLGRFLRKSSLDELPQFVNVLLGQMSVVGPRPITRDEMSQYGDAADTVTAVLPGITGLWQVSGRNQLTLAERRDMDVAYVQTASFGLDMQVVFRTVLIVLRMSGQ